MFKCPSPNVVVSDTGFSVTVLGRTGIEYREGGKTMFIDSEVQSRRGIAVFTDSIVSWNAPHTDVPIADGDKQRIISNLRAAFDSLNDPADVVGSEHTPPYPTRGGLFGALSIEHSAASPKLTAFPWNAFATARQYLIAADRGKAIENWMEIVDTPGLKTIHYVQAWHYLRQQQCNPPESQIKTIFGVVFEVGTPVGTNTLAVYRDDSARYIQLSRDCVAWEHPDSSLNGVIASLINAATSICSLLEGPVDVIPAVPEAGQMKLSLLTPSGIYVGRIRGDDAANDPVGRHVFEPALAMVEALLANKGSTPC